MRAPPEQSFNPPGIDDFPELADVELRNRLDCFVEALSKWGRAINLVARSDLASADRLWRRHVLDSLQLAPIIDDAFRGDGSDGDSDGDSSSGGGGSRSGGSGGGANGHGHGQGHGHGGARRIADLGAGGGFPGLVVAAAMAARAPENRPQITLVEADARKCAFLRAAAHAMNIEVDVETARIESLKPLQADCITARACAPLTTLIPWGARHLAPEGRMILLKGQDVDRELTEAAKYWIFEARKRPSRTDRRGAVLTIQGIRHGRS